MVTTIEEQQTISYKYYVKDNYSISRKKREKIPHES
jgi:hypothetical protein